jgi:uncharacterized protein YqjF (DUF2071 family)
MTVPASGLVSRTGFITAEWRHIAILNYTADPALLRPLLPNGVELDLWNGQPFMSIVGLLFERISVLGIRLPFFGRFEQVNLRFYVRRQAGSGWRRGVVFVREFVPYRSLAAGARLFYNQNFKFARMRHRVETASWQGGPTAVEYGWRNSGRWNRLGLTTTGPSQTPPERSLEEFIAERYWGYADAARGRHLEFEVRRPAWLVSPADGWLDCDTAKVYGEKFADLVTHEPASAFLAWGSAVGLGIRARPKVAQGRAAEA